MRSGKNRSRLALLAMVLCGLIVSSRLPSTLRAQDGYAPFDGNYNWFDSRRRQAIALQLGTQEHLRALAGLPSRLDPGLRGDRLNSIDAGLAWDGGYSGWRSPDVFEPWPLAPGDIFGRPFDGATPTPLGHVITPTGPNGYTYEPFYSTPAPRQPAPLWPGPPARLHPSVPPVIPAPSPYAPSSPVPPFEELPPPGASDELREF